MEDRIIELRDLTILRADAIGRPGQRVFFFQAGNKDKIITLLIEKSQLLLLAGGLHQLFKEVKPTHPNLPVPPLQYSEDDMHIHPPVDPLFSVANMALGYDPDDDMIVIIFRTGEDSDIRQDTGLSEARLWCSRSQAMALVDWAGKLIGRGRQKWPSDNKPILPREEFSPRHNGHKS